MQGEMIFSDRGDDILRGKSGLRRCPNRVPLISDFVRGGIGHAQSARVSVALWLPDMGGAKVGVDTTEREP